MKVQWTEQLVATQQQKTEEIKKQTEQIKVDMEENNKYTSKILPFQNFDYNLRQWRTPTDKRPCERSRSRKTFSKLKARRTFR